MASGRVQGEAIAIGFWAWSPSVCSRRSNRTASRYKDCTNCLGSREIDTRAPAARVAQLLWAAWTAVGHQQRLVWKK